MAKNEFDELFTRYEGNPILRPENWSYKVGSVINPGAIRFRGKVLLLVRVEDRQGYSHLTKAVSEDGRTNWEIDPNPTLIARDESNEAVFGLEDPRIVWFGERKEYIITCVSFFADVAGEPPGVSLATTTDFSSFTSLDRPLLPVNKDASLFPRIFNNSRRYALIHRPIIGDRADIWVSFSPDLKYWGDHRVLIPTRRRSWDCSRVGLGPPPIETSDGWLVIYHGARDTASGTIYRIGLALLDLETLEVIRRSQEWVFEPRKTYERVGDVDGIVFPCGTVTDEKTKELFVYYGAADSVIALATADLDEILSYLKTCPKS